MLSAEKTRKECYLERTSLALPIEDFMPLMFVIFPDRREKVKCLFVMAAIQTQLYLISRGDQTEPFPMAHYWVLSLLKKEPCMYTPLLLKLKAVIFKEGEMGGDSKNIAPSCYLLCNLIMLALKCVENSSEH